MNYRCFLDKTRICDGVLCEQNTMCRAWNSVEGECTFVLLVKQQVELHNKDCSIITHHPPSADPPEVK